MCTALTYKTENFYFGRTLDHDFSYGQTVTVTPRRYVLNFRDERAFQKHYAIIGMAYVADGYPLYFDAVNEKGLGVAALKFVGSAHYNGCISGKTNISYFEFITWVLGQFSSVSALRSELSNTNITSVPFSKRLPVAKLHWLVADRENAITVEAVSDGLRVYDNPVGVLTNDPPFDMQMFALNDYMFLSPKAPENRFSLQLDLKPNSRGSGTIGLPGDLSSRSRFVRAAFAKMNSVSDFDEKGSVGQFFHIMDTVKQVRGCCDLCEGKYEITQYTSCCNADKGIYYYTTYQNRGISAVDMHSENLDSETLICYPLNFEQQINCQNKKA